MTSYQDQVLKVALDYYDQGLCVIRIEHGSKSPELTTWREYQKERPSREQVEQWFSDGKDHNIGVVCGKSSGGLVAVCFNNMSIYELAFRGEDPATFTKVHRSHRGMHILIKTEQDIKVNRSRDSLIEIIGSGGLVVMPPSLHPDGIYYQDINPEIEDFAFIPDFWDWVEHLAFRAGFIIVNKRFIRQADWVSETLTSHVEEGNRDNTCIKLAGFLRNHWQQEKVAGYLVEWDGSFCEPPLGRDVVLRKVESAFSYEPVMVEATKGAVIETSFFTLPDGTIGEEVRNPETGKVGFIVNRDGKLSHEDDVIFENKSYKPIDDDMVKLQVILFPSEATKYESATKLLEDIQTFIHRYLDVREDYEQLASYYVLFTWVYDAFTVLPYLRFIGGWSTGKSRGLDVLAAICYKAMQVSGATTISPMFRIMEKFAGTLIIDEADIAKGDEFTEFIKVLNTGYQKGKPLLRAERKGDAFEPRAYNVYCPKIVATRHKYRDAALESRFLTEQMDRGFDKERIPLNLPAKFHEEAVALRNQLLHFRLTKLKGIQPEIAYAQRGIEPRVWQVLAPLMQLIEEEDAKQRIWDYAYKYTQVVRQDRGESLLGEVVVVLFGIIATDETPTVKAITEKVNEEYHSDKDRLTSRRVGGLLRELGIVTKRYSNGYRIEVEASQDAIELIKRQYDIEPGGEGLGEETKEEPVEGESEEGKMARIRRNPGKIIKESKAEELKRLEQV